MTIEQNNTFDLDLTDLFDHYLLWFFDVSGHISYCTDASGNRYQFSSEIVAKVFSQKEKNGGFFLQNVPKWLQKYHSTEYEGSQQFAVFFAAWYGLSKELCIILANKNRKQIAWQILNCCLCGMSEGQIQAILKAPQNTLKQKKQLLSSEWQGLCDIQIGDHTVKAKKQEDVLIDPLSGNCYQDLYE